MVVHLLTKDTTGCTTMSLYTPPKVAQQEGKASLSRSFSTESFLSVEALYSRLKLLFVCAHVLCLCVLASSLCL